MRSFRPTKANLSELHTEGDAATDKAYELIRSYQPGLTLMRKLNKVLAF